MFTLKFIQNQHISQTLRMNNLYFLERGSSIKKNLVDVVLQDSLIWNGIYFCQTLLILRSEKKILKRTKQRFELQHNQQRKKKKQT